MSKHSVKRYPLYFIITFLISLTILLTLLNYTSPNTTIDTIPTTSIGGKEVSEDKEPTRLSKEFTHFKYMYIRDIPLKPPPANCLDKTDLKIRCIDSFLEYIMELMEKTEISYPLLKRFVNISMVYVDNVLVDYIWWYSYGSSLEKNTFRVAVDAKYGIPVYVAIYIHNKSLCRNLQSLFKDPSDVLKLFGIDPYVYGDLGLAGNRSFSVDNGVFVEQSYYVLVNGRYLFDPLSIPVSKAKLYLRRSVSSDGVCSINIEYPIPITSQMNTLDARYSINETMVRRLIVSIFNAVDIDISTIDSEEVYVLGVYNGDLVYIPCLYVRVIVVNETSTYDAILLVNEYDSSLYDYSYRYTGVRRG